MQCEVPKFVQAALGDEDIRKGGVGDAALQFKDGQFADAIFIAGQSPDEVGDVSILHGWQESEVLIGELIWPGVDQG